MTVFDAVLAVFVLPSTGTWTRQPKPNQIAGDRCSAAGSLAEFRSKEVLVPQSQPVSQCPFMAHLYGPAVRCKPDMTIWR